MIPLSGPLTSANAEISGMAWYGDWLILLPQYPHFQGQGDGDGFLYALGRDDLLAHVRGDAHDPIEPVAIPFYAPGLRPAIAGYEGYEAIAFDGDRAFLTIEASPITGMIGYILVAEMAPDLSELTVDVTSRFAIDSQTDIPNISEEAILVWQDEVLVLHEANGPAVNPAPVARVFAIDLTPLGNLPFASIPYRLTDLTTVVSDGTFWGINYFFPGDGALREPVDPLAERYGVGASHSDRDGVERLVQFRIDENGIVMVDRPPIQLSLLPDDLRNWEGIEYLEGEGFLLVTDKFPGTLFAFVAWPDG